MLSEQIVQIRRSQETLSPERVNKAAYGPFCDSVRRLACLTPTQAEVARFIAWATLRQGYTSLAYSSLAELTQVRSHGRPFAGLGKNDLSPALAALAHFGIVRLEERAAMESGVPPVTLLLLIADATQWAVPANAWRFSEAEERELLEHLLACRQRWTKQLPGLAAEADLHDARAALAVEQAAARQAAEPETIRATCRGGSNRETTWDARTVLTKDTTPRAASERSESRNGETPIKQHSVLTFGTATVKPLNSLKQKAVQPLNSVKADDSNRLLAMLSEQFERVHGCELTAKEMMNSGACWRMVARRWPNEFEVQVGELRNFINSGGKIKSKAWFYVQCYFTRAVGLSSWSEVCEKSKESFTI